jgi:hypothetical protein
MLDSLKCTKSNLMPSGPMIRRCRSVYAARFTSPQWNLPANLSGDLNPNRLLGIDEIHMIAQQVAEIGDARFDSIFAGKRMIAESPVLRNKDAVALLSPSRMTQAMELQPKVDRPGLFYERPIDRNLNVVEFLIGADHQLDGLNDGSFRARDPKEIDGAPPSCPSRYFGIACARDLLGGLCSRRSCAVWAYCSES